MKLKSVGRGFTLIELLVVIAIIAILAAILFPVFMSAKEQARLSRCQGNQKQLLHALLMYTEDYGGRLPRVQFCTDGVVNGEEFRLYHKYVRNYDILRCPGSPYSKANSVRKPAYAYNQHCLCAPQSMMSKYTRVGSSDIYALDEKKIGATFPNWPGRPLGDVSNPRNCPAIFCSESLHGSRWTNENYGYGWEPEDAVNGTRMVNPHNAGALYGFLDGHVKHFKPNGRTAGNTTFYMAINGIDYDGNGTLGDGDTMR